MTGYQQPYVVPGAAPPHVWATRLGARFDPNGPAAHKQRFAGFRMGARLGAPMSLPSQVNLRQYFPAVNNQTYNSCVAESLTAAYQYAAAKASGYNPAETGSSRLFLYYQARLADGMENRDEGAFIGSGAQSLVATGLCEEQYHSYSLGPFVRPDRIAYTDALDHKALTVRMVDQNVNFIRELLASGLPVTIGFLVFPSIQSPQIERSGDIPFPSSSERSHQPLGGHAVVLVGYDDARQCFLLRNSWGTTWGQQGYGSISYAYISDSYLSQDFWVITEVNDDSVPGPGPGPGPEPGPGPFPPEPQPCPCPEPIPVPVPQPYVECCTTCDPCKCCCARTRLDARWHQQQQHATTGVMTPRRRVAVAAPVVTHTRSTPRQPPDVPRLILPVSTPRVASVTPWYSTSSGYLHE